MLGDGEGWHTPPLRILFLGFRSPKRIPPREFMNKNFLKNMPNMFVIIT